MWKWRKRLWDRIASAGKAPYVASVILVVFLSFLGGDLFEQFLSHFKWIDPVEFHPWWDFFSAVSGGAFGGLLGWMDIERKHEIEARKRAGLDATMI